MSKLAFQSISAIALVCSIGVGATASTAVAQPLSAGADAGHGIPAKPLPWRGTNFNFNQAMTTTTVGIGRDNIGGESEFYGMQWDLNPVLFVLDQEHDKIRLDASIGMGVELTDSDSTKTEREPYLTDAQLGAQYTRDIFVSEDKEWATRGALRTRFIFPTSEPSMNSGRYLTFQLGGWLRQQFKLLGNEADGLQNITVQAGLTWSHLFSRSYQPTNESLNRIRQNATGVGVKNDILTSGSFDIDRLIPSLTINVPLYKDLSFSVQGGLVARFRHPWEGQACEAQTLTGCVKGDVSPEQISYLTNSIFDVSLSQGVFDVVYLTLGYNNETLSLGEDGLTRNPFYSPDAQFYLDITTYLDEVYSKASGRSQFESPVVSSTGMPSL